MINVYMSNVDDSTKETVYKIFNSVDIPKNVINVVDADKQPFDSSNLCNVAFGKKPTLGAIKAYAKEGIIEMNKFNGRPLIDEENAFFFYSVPIELTEIMKSDENKLYVFEMFQDLAQLYLKWNPFNDEINFGSVLPEAARDNIKQQIVADADAAMVGETHLDDTQDISTIELMHKLIEKIDFSDAGLGKSLAKWDKISLATHNGYVLNVFPTANFADNEAEKVVNITYKDLLSLLKITILTGSKTISFSK